MPGTLPANIVRSSYSQQQTNITRPPGPWWQTQISQLPFSATSAPTTLGVYATVSQTSTATLTMTTSSATTPGVYLPMTHTQQQSEPMDFGTFLAGFQSGRYSGSRFPMRGSILAAKVAYAEFRQGALRFGDENAPDMDRDLELTRGVPYNITFPNGAVLRVSPGGDIEVDDKDAKVLYRGCTERSFNRFLNASDLLEQFIAFLGERGVRQGDVLQTPITIFIHWLIAKAAEADKLPVPPVPVIVSPEAKHPRCAVCRRFIPRRNVRRGVMVCGPGHAAIHTQRLLEAA